MKIIHVHVQDGDLGSTITTLINLGYTIAVPIDRVDEPIIAAARAEGRAAVKERIARQRAEADIFIAERDQRTKARIAKDEARLARAEKRYMQDQHKAAMHDALNVECRSCGAMVGENCFRPDRTPHKGYSHMTRVRDHQMTEGR